ncbi:MAG: response regulator [Anaerolineales bacterium]|nr:response regulator [Anaerolineales bacterium]
MDEGPLAIVIEDNEDLVNLLAQAIAWAGYTRVEKFLDGESAMAWLQDGNVPIFISLDLHLPGKIRGLDILFYVQKEQRLKDTVVVVVTADAILASELEGQVETMLKPLPTKALVSRARQALTPRAPSAQRK